MASKKRKASSAKSLTFDKKLILNQYMLHLFEADSFEVLSERLKNEELECLDEQNISMFYHRLTERVIERVELTRDVLLIYDENIVRHTKAIINKREPIKWKYFQYLSLLFTEIYLDRYFSDSNKLLNDLNEFVEQYNVDKLTADQIEKYTLDDLKKLAFWNATGSGKTLLMHVNLLQYQHYLALHGRTNELNRIILLTPNEGLSLQHLQEFELSGLNAMLFDKATMGPIGKNNAIEIIDIHKLKDEMGDKTVAVDAFEGNNLVLVDEGHRGSSGEEWKSKRDKLCEKGFSFEYSATFGQAMKASGKKELEQEYAKCILFDYSYKYFYGDGYGKDYRILNLADDQDDNVRHLYLTACLLTYYQQTKYYLDNTSSLKAFLIERPLWIFVGSSVNAVRTVNKKKVSDVVDILLFLARFIKHYKTSIEMLNRLISGKPNLLDPNGRDIFENKYTYLVELGLSGEEIYRDILEKVFNTNMIGNTLRVEDLKGVDGEVCLRLGENDPFGVINIGDVSGFMKLCEDHQDQLELKQRDFSHSLFQSLNDHSSKVNILIGSKKFTEGWSSWRVSTMGLMNIGKKEGSQIIQLFGRGVRLKGYNFSLKRSKHLQKVPVQKPKYIHLLETLNIFGVRADYMQQFKEYLEDEGLPDQEERESVVIEVRPTHQTHTLKLKTLKLQDGKDFKRQAPKPTLDLPNDYLKNHPIVIDWYPKIQAMESGFKKSHSAEITVKLNQEKFTEKHVAFLNLNEIYFDLQRFKNERAWFNLNLDREQIRKLLLSHDWYTLYIPKEELEFTSFSKVRRWQEIAVAMLKRYCEHYYLYKKKEWEKDFLEYCELKPEDSMFVKEYSFSIDPDMTSMIAFLNRMKKEIKDGKIKGHTFSNVDLIYFSQHLYYPLIHMSSTSGIKVSPVHLNEGESEFILDLKNYYENNESFFKDKELYVLRNQTRGKGIGFFEAGNFYPDFILWLKRDKKQYITFVDPKGLRNLSVDSSKLELYKSIKEIQTKLGDPAVILNAFILSVTPYFGLPNWGTKFSVEELENRHVLFQKEDRDNYIGKIFENILL